MTDTPTVEQRPQSCPVCGEPPKWRGTRHDYARGLFRLQCLGETHLVQPYGPTEAEAIAAWNLRTNSPAVDAVERVADLRLNDGALLPEAWLIRQIKDGKTTVLSGEMFKSAEAANAAALRLTNKWRLCMAFPVVSLANALTILAALPTPPAQDTGAEQVLRDALQDTVNRFEYAAYMCRNVNHWSGEAAPDGSNLEDWVWAPSRAALANTEKPR